MADTDKTFTLDDFLDPVSKNSIRTEFVVFKREPVRELPEWYQRMLVGDYPLFLLLAYHGNIRYIDQIMSVYRKHPGGVWTSNIGNDEFWVKYLLSLIDMYQAFDQYSDYLYHKKIRIRVAFLRFLVDEKQSRKNIFRYWKDMPLPLLSYVFVRLYVNPPVQWIRDNFIMRICNHFIIH